MIGTASYLYTNEDPTVGGVLLSATVGTVVGGLGGAASALGGKYVFALSLAAGLVSGGYTFFTTDGPLAEKVVAGLSSFAATAGATYLGSLIPLDGLKFGMTVAGNVIFGMTVSGYIEGLNVLVQTELAKVFEKGGQTKPYHNEQTTYAPYVSSAFHSSIVPEVIPIYP